MPLQQTLYSFSYRPSRAPSWSGGAFPNSHKVPTAASLGPRLTYNTVASSSPATPPDARSSQAPVCALQPHIYRCKTHQHTLYTRLLTFSPRRPFLQMHALNSDAPSQLRHTHRARLHCSRPPLSGTLPASPPGPACHPRQEQGRAVRCGPLDWYSVLARELCRLLQQHASLPAPALPPPPKCPARQGRRGSRAARLPPPASRTEEGARAMRCCLHCTPPLDISGDRARSGADETRSPPAQARGVVGSLFALPSTPRV